MAEIINIKNEAGEVQYPVTKPECVIDENGKSVLTLIQENGTELRQEIDELSTETETIRTEIESQNELIEDLQNTKIDKEADDYYPQLSVGVADNLAGVDEVDSEFNFRRSGGGAISDGVARVQSIKGNSVVWNQRFAPRNFTLNGITTTYQDGKYHSVGQLTNTFFNLNQFDANELNHKYLFIAAGFSSSFSGRFSLLNRNANVIITNGFAYILHNNTNPSSNRYIGFSNMTKGDEIDETYTLVQYDLTQMFGAGNEPTTIEEFYARKPMGIEDENAYNEGEVIHCDVQSIESQGVNQWDGMLERGRLTDGLPDNLTASSMVYSPTYIPVLSNTQYYAKIGLYKGSQVVFYPHYYDHAYNYLSTQTGFYNNKFTIPANAAFMRFFLYAGEGLGTGFSDICINISDTSINGKYFPYIKRTEDLSIIRKYFPQGMKSAGSAHDEIRYNKASGKWEKVVRIGEVDLGLLNWEYATATSIFYARESYFFANQSLLSAKYGNKNGQNEDKNMYAVGGSVRILDSAYTDAAFFKAAMQGVILYYELAEPIVTELDAEDQFKDLDYQVWNCGTEKAIAEGKSAPLAADITYGFNAIGKIKELESLVAALRAKVGI